MEAQLPKSSPLPLREPVGSNYDADPVDTIITKRSLSRLGYFDDQKHGLTPFPTKELFDAIKSFQTDQGLHVDGVMKPDGPTAQRISSLQTSPKGPTSNLPAAASKIAGRSGPTPEQCDHLFYNVDIPVCRAIQGRRGKRAAANCYHSAAARYAACLHGVSIDDLPPLNTWNQ
jgi:hypothetical protein